MLEPNEVVVPHGPPRDTYQMTRNKNGVTSSFVTDDGKIVMVEDGLIIEVIDSSGSTGSG